MGDGVGGFADVEIDDIGLTFAVEGRKDFTEKNY